MGCEGENKNSQKHWKSEFSEEQLSHLFAALGKNVYPDKTPKGELAKFLEAVDSFPNPNPRFTAGYTYLGQFLAHEMTFNVNTLSDIKSSLEENFRSPGLDLDSVYGKGPLVEPIYYDHNRYGGRVHLSLQEPDQCNGKALDFTRIIQGKHNEIAVPVIPDVRNDENILVAHIHLSIMQFHNKIADEIIDRLSKDLEQAKKEEKDTKIRLSHQVFGDFINEPQLFGENDEKENTFLKFSEFLQKQSNKTAPAASFHAVASEKKQQGPTNSGFQVQLNDLRQDLAQFLEAPKFSGEAIEDPVIAIHVAQTKYNTLLDKIFAIAKQETVWHFQWLILTDFLPKVVGKKMMKSILPNFSKFKVNTKVPIKRVCKYGYCRLNEVPFKNLPAIFTGAFFRFGHSLVLDRYEFKFVGEDAPKQTDVITVKKSLTPIKNNVRLYGFFDPSKAREAENASGFDLLINSIMTNKVSNSTQNHNNNIVVRNLRQTAKMSLPSGQWFAANEIDDENVEILTSNSQLIKDELKKSGLLNVLRKSFPKDLRWGKNDSNFSFTDFLDHSPPWFYMALEAHFLGRRKHLGPVAGRVVAEVIIKLLESDPTSILGKENLNSRPLKVKEKQATSSTPSSYTMADFLIYTNTFTFE